jgi:hypothetical protein
VGCAVQARPASTSEGVGHPGGRGPAGKPDQGEDGVASQTGADINGGGRPDPDHGLAMYGDGVRGAEPTASGAAELAPGRSRRAEAEHRYAPSTPGAFLDVAPVLPIIAVIATVFAYVGGLSFVAGQTEQAPSLVGAGVALAIGGVLIVIDRFLFTAADRAHPESFAEVRQRVDGLAARLDVLRADPALARHNAVGEAESHYQALEADLVRGGPQWVVGSGYINALTRLHRTEEVLITVQPVEEVLVDALTDEMRLSGARLNDIDHLRGKLRAAVETLNATVASYLNEPPRRDQGTTQLEPSATTPVSAAPTDASITTPPNQNGATPPSAPGPNLLSISEARIALRQVRRAINNFRDESRSRLVRSRTRLLATMTFTGVITYVLLAFAVNIQEPREENAGLSSSDPIVAAAAFYLVGAVVGLFNRLYVESGDAAAGEDYGLSRARLLLTPMLSGLAAVGGVLITGMLSGVVAVNAVTPSAVVAMPTPAAPTPTVVLPAIPSPEAAGTNPLDASSAGSAAAKSGAKGTALALVAAERRATLVPREPLAVSDVFTLKDYPFGLVLAALFGLTPKAFLERLQRSSEESRLDLRSTEAHSPARTSSADQATSAANV